MKVKKKIQQNVTINIELKNHEIGKMKRLINLALEADVIFDTSLINFCKQLKSDLEREDAS